MLKMKLGAKADNIFISAADAFDANTTAIDRPINKLLNTFFIILSLHVWLILLPRNSLRPFNTVKGPDFLFLNQIKRLPAFAHFA
jgi:hypothetical protein